MNKSKLVFSMAAIVAFSALFIAMTGCEEDEDIGDLDSWFAEHPYVSDPRESGRESGRSLTIDPSSVQISAVGDTFVFTASGGSSPFSWDVANSAAGTIVVQSNDRQAIYTVVTLAANNVIAYDSKGDAGIADVEFQTATLTVSPQGPDPATGDTVTFTASGGYKPYTWTAFNTAIGRITGYGDANRTTATYLAVDGTKTNYVTVVDNNGNSAQTAVY